MHVTRNAIRALVVSALLAAGARPSSGEEASAPADSADARASVSDTTRVAPASGNPKPPRRRRVFFGGGVSFTFGTITRVSVSPLIGYQISRLFSVGAQLSYDYMRQESGGTDFTVRSYGGSTFGRMHVNNFYAHVEPAVYDQEVVTTSSGKTRHTVPYLFVGGGAFYPIAPRLRAFVQVTFDVLQDPDSPYDRGESFVTTGIAVGP
jgi:hypothetical protein